MSQINQIQMSFAPVQDRLLLRLNTVDSTGYQFWLTRRYTKLLWPVLVKMLQKDEHIIAQHTEQAKKEVLSFQHQEAAQKMDYSKKFDTRTSPSPLGDTPVLLAKISVKDREDGAQILAMHPENGQGIELALDQTLLHSICKLLEDTVSKTDWDIDLSRTLSTMAVTESVQSKAIN